MRSHSRVSTLENNNRTPCEGELDRLGRFVGSLASSAVRSLVETAVFVLCDLVTAFTVDERSII